MTLIIGIKCEDAIVLGADGAATLGVMDQTTARQATKKLEIIRQCLVVGVSGPVGLAQLIRGEVENLWDTKKLAGVKPHEAMAIMRDALWKHVAPEFAAAQTALPVIGVGVAAQSAVCSSIVALPISRSGCLFQFNQQCSPEEATANLPFCVHRIGATDCRSISRFHPPHLLAKETAQSR